MVVSNDFIGIVMAGFIIDVPIGYIDYDSISKLG
jgi:hypothetical protein